MTRLVLALLALVVAWQLRELVRLPLDRAAATLHAIAAR